ncbi:MAG TPA: flagellar biosynthesis anti-sigma factor FlgM [Anaerolineales bacterium]|nr:flagellar biosynthesis anti-sigma factor FlgM [Anaerolineales bacterium]HRF49639.1 flagellar biosynthesis anti-sigma factor FlgM [Anaerolineales bacterium]
MKIEPNGNDIQRIEQVRAVRATQPTAPTQASGAVSGPDQAQFSNRGIELAKARTALSAVPEVREDRVAELRSQIQAGTYQVPVEALAEKLMRAVTG